MNPFFDEEYDPQVQGTLQNPSKVNTKKNTPMSTIIKLRKPIIKRNS